MVKIWSEMKKPEKYLKSSLIEFFTFDYCALPSPKYESQAFESALGTLKMRFNQNQPENLFSSIRNQARVPMDGYSYYVNQMWKHILDAKDLDLPGERTLAATHRC